MFGYSERQEHLSIDNAFHVQVVIHLESLDRNCGRLTKKPVQLPVIVMALAQRALHRPDCRGLTSGHHVSRRWCPLRFIVLHAPNESIPLLHVGGKTLVQYCIPFSMEWLISSLSLSS
jgi:hypothetical protein